MLALLAARLPGRLRGGSGFAVAALAALCVTSAVVVAQAQARSSVKCFGAASEDPERRCDNPRLRLSVTPKPADALLLPDARCDNAPTVPAVPEFCAFGVAPAVAGATVALLGDSHASHWRAAVDEMARSAGWHGASLTRSGCPFTPLVLTASAPVRAKCAPWFEAVPRWLAAHPEVKTVFISAHAGNNFPVPASTSLYEAKVTAAMEAFDRLPASVERIVVLRDVPIVRVATADCVDRAIRRRRPPGPACALPQRKVLRADSQVEAARRKRSPRIQVMDLTPFMCRRGSCPPVVGGVLVHRDQHHLTERFSRTLGPYLLRNLRRLVTGPPAPRG